MGLFGDLFGSKKTPQPQKKDVLKKNEAKQQRLAEMKSWDEIGKKHTYRNLEGIELENKGKTEEAIALYELNVKEGCDGNHPYDRLAIIYRKGNQIDEEIRVLKRGIEVFEQLKTTSPRQDVTPKLEKFRDRLIKAENLLKNQ